MRLLDLPDQILFKIISYLESDEDNLRQVCSKLQNLVDLSIRNEEQDTRRLTLSRANSEPQSPTLRNVILQTCLISALVFGVETKPTKTSIKTLFKTQQKHRKFTNEVVQYTSNKPNVYAKKSHFR